MNSRIIGFLLVGMLFLTGCGNRETVMTAQESSSVMDETTATELEKLEQTSQESTLVYVYVCGHVERPGVYSLAIGSRICDALNLAGGVTENGKPEALNQAECIEDGQTIYVPGVDEEQGSVNNDDGLVDINKADKSTLMTLPGIGESKAEIILQYREEHGAFESIEDLMAIPGIKEGVFNKIKDYIKV